MFDDAQAFFRRLPGSFYGKYLADVIAWHGHPPGSDVYRARWFPAFLLTSP